MAIRKSPILVGRGNEDHPFDLSFAAAAEVFTLDLGTGIIGTGTVTSLTIPIPSDSGFTVRISGTTTAPTDGDINVAGGITNASQLAALNTAINDNANFSTSLTDSVITITLAATGGVNAPTLVFAPTSWAILVTGRGRDTFSDEITQYVFSGPFTDVVPVGDPLHGMATMARIFSDFFNGYIAIDITGAQAGVETRFRNLYDGFRTSLAASFPQSFANSGVVRGVAENRKIAIKGSRRDSKQQVGRGKKLISDTFVNDTADYGLRQLILRIYDEVFDIFTNLNGVLTFADGKDLVEKSLVEFNLEFGELGSFAGVRASNPGVEPVLYENTIVEGSGDQGLLIYSDELIKVINDTVFPGTDGTIGNWTTWKASLATNVGNTQKLKLKN